MVEQITNKNASVKDAMQKLQAKKLCDWEGCLKYRGVESNANYGYGSNATYIILIIDAVDLLRSVRVNGFCMYEIRSASPIMHDLKISI